jgi:hypothetical protein
LQETSHCLLLVEENEGFLLPVPVLDSDGKWDGAKVESIETTKDEYFNQISLLLKDCGENFSLLEAFGALNVCPYGFVDDFSSSIVALESDASQYHVLPSGGGIFNEPEYLMEAFRSVRAATGDYYIWRARKDAKK